MTVRGGKSKMLIYVGAVIITAALVLLYHSSSQRLYDSEKLYEKCHMNEESLSAQLQVVLEYKERLAKSLRQERNDHRQTKEDYQTKLEEERQQRERENTESITKFTALQQQYKLLQSQHEDVNSEFNQVRQQQLDNIEEKTQLETQIKSLQLEIDRLKDHKVNDLESLKTKYLKIEQDKDKLTVENGKLSKRLDSLESNSNYYKKQNIQLERDMRRYKEKADTCTSDNVVKESLANMKFEKREETINEPDTNRNAGEEPQAAAGGAAEEEVNKMVVRSSTKPTKVLREFGVNYNNMLVNTSTPVINPEALLSQENKTGQVNRMESLDNRANVNHAQLNPLRNDVRVGGDDNPNDLRFPGLINHFGHVPEVRQYREMVRGGGAVVHDVGAEVGDEGEPVVVKHQSGGEDVVRHPNKIQNNAMEKQHDYQHYVEEYDKDGRKEEEDDDDVDHIDLQNINEVEEHQVKNVEIQQHQQQQQQHQLMDNGRDSVMVNPK